MNQFPNLKLQPVAIGSLPYDNVDDAMELVGRYFKQIPFFPQMTNINKNEGMINQILEGLPSFLDYKEFYSDYRSIIYDNNSEKLKKYAINGISFPEFEKYLAQNKPHYAKGQIAGPYTLSLALKGNDGKGVIFDGVLRDLIVKFLSLKAMWIISQIKSANSDIVPIIFLDEPSFAGFGEAGHFAITCDQAVSMMKEISNIIHKNDGLCGVHCCGKCRWDIPIAAGVDIINPDIYTYPDNFFEYSRSIGNFLQNGGKIAWGIVPTKDLTALKEITVQNLVENFKFCVKYLTNSGIDEKLITDNSLITSSCGVGSLDIESAGRAMGLVFELSETLRNNKKILNPVQNDN